MHDAILYFPRYLHQTQQHLRASRFLNRTTNLYKSIKSSLLSRFMFAKCQDWVTILFNSLQIWTVSNVQRAQATGSSFELSIYSTCAICIRNYLRAARHTLRDIVMGPDGTEFGLRLTAGPNMSWNIAWLYHKQYIYMYRYLECQLGNRLTHTCSCCIQNNYNMIKIVRIVIKYEEPALYLADGVAQNMHTLGNPGDLAKLPVGVGVGVGVRRKQSPARGRHVSIAPLAPPAVPLSAPNMRCPSHSRSPNKCRLNK